MITQDQRIGFYREWSSRAARQALSAVQRQAKDRCAHSAGMWTLIADALEAGDDRRVEVLTRNLIFLRPNYLIMAISAAMSRRQAAPRAGKDDAEHEDQRAGNIAKTGLGEEGADRGCRDDEDRHPEIPQAEVEAEPIQECGGNVRIAAHARESIRGSESWSTTAEIP